MIKQGQRLELKNDKESGAIAIIFAVLISSTLLFALFAIVADVSSIYSERRVVQNAADSAALAVASECANNGFGAIEANNGPYIEKVCVSASNAQLFATYYANKNSPDQITRVTEICGSVLNTCAPQPQGNLKCQIIPTQYSNFVRVVTQSSQIGGTSIIPIFSSLFTPSPSGVDVFGCAQVAWGNAGSASVVFPLSLSICDYQQSGLFTSTDFAPNNPTLQDGCSVTDLSNVTRTYTSPLSGFALTTGFGCPGSSDPQIISVGDQLRIETNLPAIESICGGSSQFYSSIAKLVGNKIVVPAVGNVICNSQSNNCQGNFQFQVAGFLSFNFLGGKFKNRGSVGDAPTGGWPNECNANRNCIYGNFDKGLVAAGSINTNPGVPNTGTTALMLLP